MEKFFYKILFVSTIAVMVVFLIQTVTGFVSLKPLNGVTVETEKPKLTFKSFVDGTFQSGTEQYYREHFGFREWLIRLYNQYLWSCFHETNNATIMRGKGNWLFEEVHVRDHYESLMYQYTDDTTEMKRLLETEALRLWKVQALLEEYNIHIFVDINPGKDMIYPEYLPKNRSYSRPVGIRAYDYLEKRFDELGVNYIDFVPVFKNIKDSVAYPLFTQTGTHWSNIASWHAFDSIIRYMETLGNQNLVNLYIGEMHHHKETRPPDNDLELVLNLASPIKTPKNLYAYVGIQKDSTASKPNFLAVGDSYYWNILDNTPMWDFFQSYPYWYYNNTIYCDAKHTSISEVDFEQELMRYDYIMLIYSPVTMYEFSSFFLPKALLHLCYDKAAIDSMTRDLTETIKGDPVTYNNALQEAEKKHQSVEEILYNKASYLISIYPEQYFKELDGDHLPTSRNKDLKAIRQKHTSTLAE